jgi:hypothetical protein
MSVTDNTNVIIPSIFGPSNITDRTVTIADNLSNALCQAAASFGINPVNRWLRYRSNGIATHSDMPSGTKSALLASSKLSGKAKKVNPGVIIERR